MIYRLGQIPEAAKAIDTWRKRAADDGHPRLHVIGVAAPREEKPWSSSLAEVLDDAVTFPPGSGVRVEPVMSPHGKAPIPGRADAVLSYDAALAVSAWSKGSIPCLSPGWDNTARRADNAYVFVGANAITWRRNMKDALSPSEHADLLVNAWNEWAEGSALEPAQVKGAALLAGLGDVFAPSVPAGKR